MVLSQRLRDGLARLNPMLPAEALDDTSCKLTRTEDTDLIQRMRALHRSTPRAEIRSFRNAFASGQPICKLAFSRDSKLGSAAGAHFPCCGETLTDIEKSLLFATWPQLPTVIARSSSRAAAKA
jgi:hypothetical protein